MKLFICKDVLCDYTCGMAIAYAETLEDALTHFEEDYIRRQLGIPTKVIDCATETQPFADWVYGGA